ncbi:MAG: efflux RND transporter periplasmic adaptor subunit, partial [Candidatus Rokuibacteriota bacterium]
STVSGSVELGSGAGIRIPASALTSTEGAAAVWLFDPATSTVSLRNVEVESQGVAEVVIAQGLVPDDIVVTAGVQTLRPGQKVRLLQALP